MPVYISTHPYFIANEWRVVAVDLNQEKAISASSPGVEINQYPPEASTVIFLGIKPQDFSTLKKNSKASVIVSMMAGLSIKTIRTIYPNAAIIRIIPNTPCAFGAGITPIYTEDIYFNDTYLAPILTALSRMGVILPVTKECMIDCATGISAGGPAYMMVIAEAMIETAKEMGFPAAEARQLVAHTLSGSAELLLRTSKTPDALAQEVMTPNGTTERGVKVLREHAVGDKLRSALHEASRRAKELSLYKEGKND